MGFSALSRQWRFKGDLSRDFARPGPVLGGAPLRDARKIENPFRLFSRKGTLLRIPSSFFAGTGLFCQFLRVLFQEADSFANSIQLFCRNLALLLIPFI